jgi:hypothetical protein
MRFQISTRSASSNTTGIIYPESLCSYKGEYSIVLKRQNDGPSREDLLRGFFIEMGFPFKSEAFKTMLASEQVLKRDWDTPEEDAAWSDL